MSVNAPEIPAWPEMRFGFVPNPSRPGFVVVLDRHAENAIMAEFCDDHAQMIYCMYATLHAKHPYAGDEFMYGHIMGYTLTLIHGAKYPKIEVRRGALGDVTIQATQPDGTVSQTKHVEREAFESDLLNRVVPPFLRRKK
jgi:hypothetical protein